MTLHTPGSPLKNRIAFKAPTSSKRGKTTHADFETNTGAAPGPGIGSRVAGAATSAGGKVFDATAATGKWVAKKTLGAAFLGAGIAGTAYVITSDQFEGLRSWAGKTIMDASGFSFETKNSEYEENGKKYILLSFKDEKGEAYSVKTGITPKEWENGGEEEYLKKSGLTVVDQAGTQTLQLIKDHPTASILAGIGITLFGVDSIKGVTKLLPKTGMGGKIKDIIETVLNSKAVDATATFGQRILGVALIAAAAGERFGIAPIATWAQNELFGGNERKELENQQAEEKREQQESARDPALFHAKKLYGPDCTDTIFIDRNPNRSGLTGRFLSYSNPEKHDLQIIYNHTKQEAYVLVVDKKTNETILGQIETTQKKDGPLTGKSGAYAVISYQHNGKTSRLPYSHTEFDKSIAGFDQQVKEGQANTATNIKNLLGTFDGLPLDSGEKPKYCQNFDKFKELSKIAAVTGGIKNDEGVLYALAKLIETNKLDNATFAAISGHSQFQDFVTEFNLGEKSPKTLSDMEIDQQTNFAVVPVEQQGNETAQANQPVRLNYAAMPATERRTSSVENGSLRDAPVVNGTPSVSTERIV